MLPESQGREPRQFLQTKDSRVITQSDSFGNEQVASEVSTKRIRPLFTIKARQMPGAPSVNLDHRDLKRVRKLWNLKEKKVCFRKR